MDKATTIATYTASGGAILFGFTANELAALTGAVVAIATFLVNLLFKLEERRDRKKMMEKDK